MKYAGMPWGMWILFHRSFEKHLTSVFGYERRKAAALAKDAEIRYRNIIAGLPAFEKADRFRMNIVSCAMFSAFILSFPERPDLESLTVYYECSMMTDIMKWFCRKIAKKKYTKKDLNDMKATAAFQAANRNPYSWNMRFQEYPDGSGYECRFTKCGICTLMKELNLFECVPAMCQLDYAMNEAGGVTDFVRQYTLAAGDSCCDCGYRKKK